MDCSPENPKHESDRLGKNRGRQVSGDGYDDVSWDAGNGLILSALCNGAVLRYGSCHVRFIVGQ